MNKLAFCGSGTTKREVLAIMQDHWNILSPSIRVPMSIGNTLSYLGSSPGIFGDANEYGFPIELCCLGASIARKCVNQQNFAVKFFEAVEPGASLGEVWPKFISNLLIGSPEGLVHRVHNDEVRLAVISVGELYRDDMRNIVRYCAAMRQAERARENSQTASAQAVEAGQATPNRGIWMTVDRDLEDTKIAELAKWAALTRAHVNTAGVEAVVLLALDLDIPVIRLMESLLILLKQAPKP